MLRKPYRITLPVSREKILKENAQCHPPAWETFAPQFHPREHEIPNHLMSLLDLQSKGKRALVRLLSAVSTTHCPPDELNRLVAATHHLFQGYLAFCDLTLYASESWELDPYILERAREVQEAALPAPIRVIGG